MKNLFYLKKLFIHTELKMKEFIKILIPIFYLVQNFAFSQTLSYYNPSVDYNGHALLTPDNSLYRAKNYDGEYQLYFNNHPWQFWSAGQYARSYKIEVVSFPFIPDEFTSTTTARNLSIPNPTSFNGVDGWSGAISTLSFPIYKTYSNEDEMAGPICNYNTSVSINRNDNTNTEFSSALVSSGFETVGGVQIQNRIIYPHSVLKHTMYIHCGPLQTDPIIDKVEFIIDHTRGIMRKYPFVNQNFAGAGTEVTHDLTIFPILVLDYDYDVTTLSTDDYDPYNNFNPIDAINYFPTSEALSTTCLPSFSPSEPVQIGEDPHNYIHPAPNSIAAYMLLNYRGVQYAGYRSNANGTALEPIGGMKQEYFIDKYIDLGIYNIDEKIIYNPSEATVTTDVTFPANYTFKTIRGVFPTVAEVDQDNTIANGGPYTDKRLVPVTTDLFYDGTNPSYPTNDPKYSSVYILENGGKITLEPCVRVFDCTFDLKTGSEIIFENWPTNQINFARYQLLLNGGKVTERDEQWLFQNKTETRTILNYEAADFIKAGTNVDNNQPQGAYIVDAGADVTFAASNQVVLKHGFRANAGSKFHAYISPVTVPGCPQRIARPDHDNSQTENMNNKNNNQFFLAPSLTTSRSFLNFKIQREGYYSIEVLNALGETQMKFFDNRFFRANTYKLDEDFTDLAPGVYICKLSGADEQYTTKFIKSN